MTDLGTDPVIEALRYTADEVQLTRAIAAMSRADPAFSRRFLDAALAVAAEKGTNTDAARRFRMTGLPSELYCIDQSHALATEGRRGLRRRLEELGDVDLRFTDNDQFAVHCEIKLESPFGPQQRERYLRSGEPLFVIGQGQGDDAHLKEFQGWLGQVRWDDLIPSLCEISEHRSWRGLLLLLQWELKGRGDARERWRALLDEVRVESVAFVNTLLKNSASVTRHPRAGAAAGQGRQGMSQDMAWFAIRVPATRSEDVLEVRLSGRSVTPTLTVSYLLPGRVLGHRKLIRRLRTSAALTPFSRTRYGCKRLLRQPTQGTLRKAIEEDIQVIAATGVLELEFGGRMWRA